MNSKKKTFSISELASEFDVTTRSIRFYEDQGLIKPERKGQTRIYSSQDKVRLKLILRGKRLGFSLAESRELFELWDETPSGSERQLFKMLETLGAKQVQLEQQLKDIQMAKIEIESAEARCHAALKELQQKNQNTSDTMTTDSDNVLNRL
ncbi:MerR family transcriptional regulator [Marinomonas primoryensis]|jgi:DNA-binding transcriptional MerR regulator|uniref:MerR family transcriptional regulator n=2 Tax=Marinomonas TaxID=28253 RepID=A0A2Z4PR82_9GAMM|nr:MULTISPECIES: MerR family DNA-binding transcriptional regulator [Marinomonas]AWY00111.1 MerR family transcriptional regulator [Marinomonas primoryensis]MDE8602170.1 MerR family DNA-binding transcriptional regulator [Marinomonas maritima]